jgi:hypothetical protein
MAPGFVLMLGAAWLYDTFLAGRMIWVGALTGVQIMVLALIARAVEKIGRHAIAGARLWGVAVFALAATLLHAPFWLPLVVGGVVGVLRAPRLVLAGLLIVALGLAIALFAGALGFPFLQVDQFLLHDNAYGIANVPVALARGGNWSLALLSGVGLVVLPTVALLAQAWAWIVPATPLSHRRRWQRITWAREWCMLDVMAVALILFIMEGQGTIRVGVKDGLWLLIAAAAFLGLSGWLGSRAAGVGMQRLEHSGAPSVR